MLGNIIVCAIPICGFCGLLAVVDLAVTILEKVNPKLYKKIFKTFTGISLDYVKNDYWEEW